MIENTCSPSIDLQRVGEPEDRIRKLCMLGNLQRNKILATLVLSAGGQISHGYCPGHGKEELERVERGMEETKTFTRNS